MIKEVIKVYSHNDRYRDYIMTALFNVGAHVMIMHMFAKYLSKRIWSRPLARIINVISQAYSGCHISNAADLSVGTTFPHPVGIVIGDGVKTIGRNIIYQNVTLGVKNGGYPTIINATIYPVSVLVGPIVIGDGAVIGALSFVDSDVEAGTVFSGSSYRKCCR